MGVSSTAFTWCGSSSDTAIHVDEVDNNLHSGWEEASRFSVLGWNLQISKGKRLGPSMDNRGQRGVSEQTSVSLNLDRDGYV